MLSRAQRLAILCGVASAHVLLIVLLPGSLPTKKPAIANPEIQLSLLTTPVAAKKPVAPIARTQTPPQSTAVPAKAAPAPQPKLKPNPAPAPAPVSHPALNTMTIASTPPSEHIAPATPKQSANATGLVLNAKALLADSLAAGNSAASYQTAQCPGADLPPRYPAAARRFNQQGIVQIVVHIASDGEVSEVELKRSSGYPLLDAAAIEQAQTWRCQPAKQGNTAISSLLQLRVIFRID